MALTSLLSTRRARSRIERALEITKVEFKRISDSNPSFAQSAECNAASRHLENVSSFLKQNDVEGSWASLHAAQRLTLYGLSDAQILDRTVSLQKESSKLQGWRQDAVQALLKLNSVSALESAFRIRDEASDDQYHKIWLTSDQFPFLISICIGALLCLAPLEWFIHFHVPWGQFSGHGIFQSPPTWSFTMAMAVVGAGTWGGSFSVAQSMFSNLKLTSIPESVASTWTTAIRSVFGGVGGFAGYAFVHSGLFKLPANGIDPIALALSVAFLFGYSGERLLARIIDSLGGNKKQLQ